MNPGNENVVCLILDRIMNSVSIFSQTMNIELHSNRFPWGRRDSILTGSNVDSDVAVPTYWFCWVLRAEQDKVRTNYDVGPY